VDEVELHLGGELDLGERAVARPLGDHAQAHLLEQDAARPGVAADVVVADDRDVVGAGDEFLLDVLAVAREHPVADRVVCDVVAERLRHAAETFAAHRHHRLIELGGGLLRHRLDIISDQTDRAL